MLPAGSHMRSAALAAIACSPPAQYSAAPTCLQGSEAEGGEQPQGALQRQPAAAGEPFQGSAVEWVLKKADQSLDEIEENPPEYAKVIYDISTGPIGELAGREGLLAELAAVWLLALALRRETEAAVHQAGMLSECLRSRQSSEHALLPARLPARPPLAVLCRQGGIGGRDDGGPGDSASGYRGPESGRACGQVGAAAGLQAGGGGGQAGDGGQQQEG